MTDDMLLRNSLLAPEVTHASRISSRGTRDVSGDVLAERVDITPAEFHRRLDRCPLTPFIPGRDQLPVSVAGDHIPDVRAERVQVASQADTLANHPKAGGDAPVTVDANYEKTADPLIRKQIEKAGARLAAVLNASLR